MVQNMESKLCCSDAPIGPDIVCIISVLDSLATRWKSLLTELLNIGKARLLQQLHTI